MMGRTFKTAIPGNDLISYQGHCRILWNILTEIVIKPEHFMQDDTEAPENKGAHSYGHIIQATASPQAKIQQASEQMLQMALLEWQALNCTRTNARVQITLKTNYTH